MSKLIAIVERNRNTVNGSILSYLNIHKVNSVEVDKHLADEWGYLEHRQSHDSHSIEGDVTTQGVRKRHNGAHLCAVR